MDTKLKYARKDSGHWTLVTEASADEISILLGRKDHGAPVPESPKVKEPLRSADQLRHVRAPQKEVLAGSTPSSVDWTSEGVVTPVKNQVSVFIQKIQREERTPHNINIFSSFFLLFLALIWTGPVR